MQFIEILKTIVLGIIQGITEWLPISSTGHMIILDEFVKLNVREEFWNLFLVVIQLGAILAVVLLFWNQIFPLNLKDKNKPIWKKDILLLWVKILVACVPAGIVGVLFDDVFAYYDDERLAAAINMLKKCGHQVIIFSCHSREDSLLR